MMTKRELQKQAESFIQQKRFNEAMDICKKIWENYEEDGPDKFNLYDASLVMKAANKESHVDFTFVDKVARVFQGEQRIANSFKWIIFHKKIKGKKDSAIIDNDWAIERLFEITSQVNLREDDTYPCPITIGVFKLLKAYSNNIMNAEKVLEWVNRLNPDYLSKKPNIISSDIIGEKEDASDFEKYYSFKTKALLKSGKYEECKSTCQLALKKIDNFHYNNSLWFNERIAISEKHLGNIKASEYLFQSILGSKAGRDKWFIYKEIAILYYEQEDFEKAWSYVVDSAFYGNEPEYMIGLFLLQARILVRLKRTEESLILAQLIGAVLKEKGWKNKLEYSKLMAYHKIDFEKLRATNFYYKKAKKFWVNERYKDIKVEEGVIIFVHKNGKFGKIKSEDGEVFNFHKRNINGKGKPLRVLKNVPVSFVQMIDIDSSIIAENITLQKEINMVDITNFKVGDIYNGNVKSITDFGIFVKLKGRPNGLLHKNALPADLKNDLKQNFKLGQQLKVKVIKVTEKGAELKLV